MSIKSSLYRLFLLFSTLGICTSCCLTRPCLFPGNHLEVLDTPPADLQRHSLSLNGDHIECWYRNTTNEQDPVLIFFYGNAQSLHGLYLSAVFTKFNGYGCHLVSIDYPGYGLSKGPTSAKRMVEAGKACLDLVKKKYRGNKIILCGWSMGSGVAVQVGKNDPTIDGMILYSPYTSLQDVGNDMIWPPLVSLFLWDDFKTFDDAPFITCPTLIVHGSNDDVIPVKHGRRLAHRFPHCDYVEVEGAGHEYIFDHSESRQALKKFINSIHPVTQ